MENKDKNLYEIGYVLVPSIPEDKVPEEVSRINELIVSNSGLVLSGEQPKFRKLSYEISKPISGGKNVRYNEGHFGWVRFETSPDCILIIDKELKSDLNVLRFLVLNLTKEGKNALKIGGKKGLFSKEKVSKKPISEKEIDKEIDSLLMPEGVVSEEK